MEELIGDVIETIRGMITHGVEGDAIAEDSHYKVNITLIEKNKPRKYRDPVWLKEAYLVDNRSMKDIATEFDITPAAVHQWLTKHNIETRKRGVR